jgi:hypothetical protein
MTGLFMRRIPTLLFWLAAASAFAPAQIYVSPHGDDANAGTATTPVRTLQRALALSHSSADHRIILHGGIYRLAAPLHLTPVDSGTVFTAASEEHPLLSGGIRLEHWREVDPARHLWAATVPASVNSRQLYINGVRATRTRGRVPVTLTETSTGYTTTDDAMSRWKNPSDIEFVYTGGNSIWSEHSEGLGAWTEPRCPVQSITGSTITMKQPCWDNSTKRVMLPNGARTANLVGPMSVGKQPEYVENAYELLGTPGQFYLDHSTHTLYYVPRKGEDLRTADVEMPVLETLVEGSGTASAPIDNIEFSGIQFAYATWLGPNGPDGFSEIQANYQVTGADGYSRQALCHLVPDGTCPFGAWTQIPANVTLSFAHHVRFVHDDFIHLGAAGLTLGDGAQNDLVQGCIFTDISGNGVQLGGVDTPLAPIAEFTSSNRIENNLFRNVGAEYSGGIPIVVGYARDTLIAHNQIDHIPYAAISMGWGGWPDKIKQAGQANNSAGNIIRDNLIHDLMIDLADGGGIYTQGLTGTSLADGEKVTGNVIYDQFSSGHEIYTDNGSSMITVSGNVMFNTNHDNWGSRHRDYYDDENGKDFDPLAIEGNYWQQGDEDSSRENVAVRGNHLIASLDEVPHEILVNAGLEPTYKDVLEQRFSRLVPPHAPGDPRRVAVYPGGGVALVTFSPPTDTGDSPIRSYTITSSTGATATISSAEFARLSYVRVPGLPDGQPVTFTVTATNGAGTSVASLPSLPIRPSDRKVQLSPPPSGVSVDPGVNGEISIHFQSPGASHPEADGSPITSYVVTVEPTGRRVVLTGRNILTLQDGKHTTFKVISGLKPGTYSFRIAAVNQAGEGAPETVGPITVQ